MVRDFTRGIGDEARAQCLEQYGVLPDAIAACVGGGSNAIGLFTAFLDDADVAIYGFEAGGEGVETGRHAATIHAGDRGVLHGARTYVLQDEDGQTIESHSISAGLDYPGVGPQHAHLAATGRATYLPVTDAEAMEAFALLSRTEGIIPAIESAHAVAGALRLAEERPGPDHPGQPVRPRRQGHGHGASSASASASPGRRETGGPASERVAPPSRRRAPRAAPRWSATCRPASPTSTAASTRCRRWSTPAATSSRSACPTATR